MVGKTSARRLAAAASRGGIRTFRKDVGSALVVAVLALAALLCYVALWANVTQKGYQRARVVAELQDLNAQNEVLRAQLATLKSPGRICSVARLAGMQPVERCDYIIARSEAQVARADR